MLPPVILIASFQSTPSVWRETAEKSSHWNGSPFQSTPSVWRETRCCTHNSTQSAISIHSLRVEGDQSTMTKCQLLSHFNPLPPCGGRPRDLIKQYANSQDFNPLPPCGGRLNCFSHASSVILFQSTPSVWRETGAVCARLHGEFISIHSLRVEGDKMDSSGVYQCLRFQSTPSVWRETTVCHPWVFPIFRFQSTPSVWRETPAINQLSTTI